MNFIALVPQRAVTFDSISYMCVSSISIFPLVPLVTAAAATVIVALVVVVVNVITDFVAIFLLMLYVITWTS